MNILEIRDLKLILGKKNILNNVTMDLWRGHIHAIVGPNGAGKSTLAFTMMGLSGYRKIEGDIILNGESIINLNIDERAKKGMTLAWQEPARFEGLTVKSFIKSSMMTKNDDEIKDALAQAGLEPSEYINRAVDKTLSGGERKKIELASIIVMKPKIVFLDEPDSGIDIESLDKIFEIIKVLKKHGTTVVLITHSLAVLKQAEHAFLMCHGEIVDKGVVSKIIKYFENKCLPCMHKNKPVEDDKIKNER